MLPAVLRGPVAKAKCRGWGQSPQRGTCPVPPLPRSGAFPPRGAHPSLLFSDPPLSPVVRRSPGKDRLVTPVPFAGAGGGDGNGHVCTLTRHRSPLTPCPPTPCHLSGERQGWTNRGRTNRRRHLKPRMTITGQFGGRVGCEPLTLGRGDLQGGGEGFPSSPSPLVRPKPSWPGVLWAAWAPPRGFRKGSLPVLLPSLPGYLVRFPVYRRVPASPPAPADRDAACLSPGTEVGVAKGQIRGCCSWGRAGQWIPAATWVGHGEDVSFPWCWAHCCPSLGHSVTLAKDGSWHGDGDGQRWAWGPRRPHCPRCHVCRLSLGF